MKNKQIKFSILALLLAVVLLFGYTVPTAYAAGTAEIAFGQVSGKSGERVTVPVTIKNNPGIASFRFRVAYDVTVLTYVSATKGEAMTGGTLNAAYQTEDKELAITWFDVKNITGDGVLFYLVFEVSESASGQYPITISYLPEDIVNASWKQVEFMIEDGLIQIGSNITGTIKSFGATDDEVMITLMQGKTEIAKTMTTDGTYRLTSVAPGNYSLVMSKRNHATRTYEISVTGEDITQDGKIHFIGDINGDGRVNVVDVARANAHAKKTVNLEGYELLCADINDDGRVNVVDVAKMNAHAKKTVFLW
ncbi:MAG: hypothetical protein IKJ16_07715 [Agathobacter sp.]|nr:hypothetical protein [Agathobacter sp.]